MTVDIADLRGPLPTGTTVLEASAGTGKTYTIAGLVARYVAEGVAQIDQLLVKVQAADAKVADFKAKNSIFAGSNGTTLPDQQISDIGKQITDGHDVLRFVHLRQENGIGR